MATKIINVLKDDRFEEILDLFRETSADEVIFVLPKHSEAFDDENSFSLLAEDAIKQNKEVLILTSNQEAVDTALKYNFTVLTSQKGSSQNSKEIRGQLTSDVDDDSNDFKSNDLPEVEDETQEELAEDTEESEELATEDQNYNISPAIQTDGGYESNLAMARSENSKPMTDILGPNREDSIRIRVANRTEPSIKVGIKKSKDHRGPSKSISEEIEDVWGSRKDSNFSFLKKEKGSSHRFKVRIPKFRFPTLSYQKSIIYFGVGAFIILAIVVYISTGSASILIKPKAHALDLILKISSSDKFLSVSPDLKNIPGQLFSIQKKVEDVFQATGERDVIQKAKGRITVYNEYGTTPQVLIATTRFQDEKGLIFRTLKTISVPGTKVENGKIIPGSIEVEVIADKAGDLYNIEPGRFAVPAFKEKGDTDRFSKFYGLSKDSMKGGIIGKAKVVTEQDYISAKKAIEERIISESSDELKNQSAGLKILSLPDPVVKDLTSTAQVDEAVDTFTVSGLAELEMVGFKEQDVHELITRYVKEANNFLIFPEKLQIEFKDPTFNDETNILGFTVLVKGLAYDQVDQEKIVDDLMGRKETDIKNYIKGVETIATAKISLFPFWVRKVPANKNKIKFELQYD